MNVKVLPEYEEYKDKLDYDTFIYFIHQQGYEPTHDSINGDCFNSIVKNLLDLNLLLETLMNCLFNLLFELRGKWCEYLFEGVDKLLSRGVGPEGIDHINQSLVRSRDMLLVLIFWLLPRYHHGTSVINGLH